MSLYTQAISSVKWNAASQAVRLSLYFLTTLLLARLLNPADFGLLGMATVFTGFIAVFNDFGLGSAVVQRRNLDQETISTIFWLTIAVGVITTLITVLISPIAANFYSQPELKPLLSFLSITFLLNSIGQVQFSLLMKALNFRHIALIESFSGLLGGIVAIVLAFMDWGVWSLAIQLVVSVGVASIIYWVISDWRPNFVFEKANLRGIVNYSGGLFGFNIVNYFSRNADYLLIGRFLGPGPLGLYTLAYRLMQFPIQNITAVVNRVLFPTLSKIQEKNEKIRTGFIKASQYIAFITFPLMIGLLILAPEFILIAFGRKWVFVIPIVQILALVGLVQSIIGLVGSIYTAKGKTKIFFYWGIISTVTVVGGIIVGLKWGILGVSIGYAIATMLLLYPNFRIPFRFINLKFSMFVFSLRNQILNAAMMGILIFISASLQRYFGLSNWIILGSNIIMGLITYLSLVIRFDRDTFNEIRAAIIIRSKKTEEPETITFNMGDSLRNQ